MRKFGTLTQEETGRMIHVLLREPRYRGGSYYRRRVGLRWSKKQVAAFVGVSVEELDQLRKHYSNRKYPPMTSEEAAVLIWKYAKKHGKWPTWRALRRSDGMPSTYFVYRRGSHVWSRVAQKYARQMSPRLIMTLPNLALRRDVINSVGAEKLIKEAGKFIQQDDFGKLWELDLGDDGGNKCLFVEVVNSTPREDGKFDHYFLRVPPATRTAREGVEWTCQMEPQTLRKFAKQS